MKKAVAVVALIPAVYVVLWFVAAFFVLLGLQPGDAFPFETVFIWAGILTACAGILGAGVWAMGELWPY